MSPATRLYDHLTDEFEARIRILPPEEGGRLTPAYNGTRWDFRYAEGEHAKQYFMLYPDFYDPATGASFRDEWLPVDEWLFARMSGSNPQMRSHIHQKMVRPGTSFYCCEGPKVVAEGTVTRITGLFEPRAWLLAAFQLFSSLQDPTNSFYGCFSSLHPTHAA